MGFWSGYTGCVAGWVGEYQVQWVKRATLGAGLPSSGAPYSFGGRWVAGNEAAAVSAGFRKSGMVEQTNPTRKWPIEPLNRETV